MRRLRLAAGIVGCLVSPALADPAMTTASSNMRRAASPYAPVVQAVPADAQVDIQSCGGDWCYGSWRGLYGFLPSFAVAQAGPPPAVWGAPPPVVVGPPVVVAPPPVVHYWGGPYAGVGWGYGWRRW